MVKTMIKDVEVARDISNLMVEFGARLNDSLFPVMEKCSPEEFQAYRRAVGKIMGEMVLEVMNPLYKQHPSIKPKEMD